MHVKNILILLSLLFISFYSVSQNKVIDSLKQELNKTISEKEKTSILLYLSKITRINNPEESIDYNNRAFNIAIANNLKEEEAKAYSNIAGSYIYSHDYNKAEEYLNKSIAIAKENDNKKLEAENYISFGVLYYYKNDYYNALINYDKALIIYKEENNTTLIAKSLTNISIIYFETKDYARALEYALECNTILKDNTDTIELAKAYMTIAECYIKLKKIALAKTYIQKSINIFEKEKNVFETTISYLILGDTYFEEKEYTKAYTIYKTTYENVKSSNDSYLKMLCSRDLAKALYNLKRYNESLLYAHESFKTAKEFEDIEVVYSTSKIIAEASGKLKKYDDLESFYKTHVSYGDSLEINDFYYKILDHKLNESESKNLKEKEIEASKRNNVLLLFISSFLFLFLLFSVYFYKKLNKLYKKANAGNKSKSIFLSKVTHEIKTPLTSIIGFSNLLKDSGLNKEQLDLNNNITSSSNRLLKLSNEILEVSKLKEEKVKLFEKPQNLNTLLNTIKEDFTTKANRKGLTFKIDKDVFNIQLFYDKNQLKQVINNLLVNAIKFTDNGEIIFKTKLESENENEVNINFIIEDTGIGISKEHIKKIQKEFYQIVSNEKDDVGVGLGLSIVNKSLYLMDSKLKIDSQLHHGSIFSFKLKLKKEELIEKEDVFVNKENDLLNKSFKILIAEDNKLVSLLIKKTLESFLDNLQVFIAYDGLEAVKLYLEKEPDIILMDLQMPNLNGFEATKSIRELQKSHIPIIACSATLMADNIEKCNIYGFDDYIEKPINKELLKTTLLKHIKEQKLKSKTTVF